MLKAALAGKVLQKGKTPEQKQFSEVKHLSTLESSTEPSKQQGWLWSSSSSSCCHPCCCSGLCVWRSSQQHSAPASAPWQHHQPLHPNRGNVLDTGQGWPSLGSSPPTVTLLPPPSPGWAAKFLLQLVKLCFSLPADFFFLMMALNSLCLER